MHPIYENRALNTQAGEIRLLTLLPPDEGNSHSIIECQLGVYLVENSCDQYIDFEATAEREENRLNGEQPSKHGVRKWMKNLQKSKPDTHCTSKNAKIHTPDTYHYVALSYAWGDDPHEKNPDRWLERTQRDEQKILINGHVFSVRRNLHAALLQFRTMDKFKQGLKIWIDAITINQDDKSEKDEQIGIMHQIYQRAGNVVVWIGPQSETEFDHWAKGEKCTECNSIISQEKHEAVSSIKVLESIGEYYPTEQYGDMDNSRDLIAAHQHREGVEFRLRHALAKWKELMLENPDYFSDSMYVHIWKFFEREYWRRVWIIQELAMGNARMPVICGDYVTRWHCIRNAAILLHGAMDVVGEMTASVRGVEDTVESVNHTASHVAGIAQLELLSHRKILPEINKTLLSFTSTPGIGGGQGVRGSILDQALALATQANCKEEKDRVRGMLHVYGIPRAFSKVQGMFDFENMTTGEVYQLFARLLLMTGNFETFALLDGCNDDSSPASWVPSFARPASRRTHPIHGPWFADGVFRSDPNSNPFISIPQMLPQFVEVETGKGIVLHLKGVALVDEIDGVGAMQPALTRRIASSTSDFQTGVVQPSKPKTLTNPLYEHEHVVKRCIYRTLTCGTDSRGVREEFKRLLSCFSEEPPQPTDPRFWNWDFFNATADLEFHGKPLRDWMDPYKERPDLMYANDEDRKDWSYASAAMAAMKSKVRGRRLFVTADRGFLGLGPMITQPGNILVTVFGCTKPIILMRAVNGKFRILGECYVDDIMEGEAQKSDMSIPDCNIGSIHVV